MLRFNSFLEKMDFFKQTDFHKKNNLWFGAPFSDRVFNEFLFEIKDCNIKNFIELGFGNLSKSILASKYFQNVYSIEIYKPYYDEALSISNNYENIKLIHGDILKEYDKIPREVSVIYSFLPSNKQEDLSGLLDIYIDYFPSGSMYYLPGIIENIKDNGNLDSLKKLRVYKKFGERPEIIYIKD